MRNPPPATPEVGRDGHYREKQRHSDPAPRSQSTIPARWPAIGHAEPVRVDPHEKRGNNANDEPDPGTHAAHSVRCGGVAGGHMNIEERLLPISGRAELDREKGPLPISVNVRFR